MAQKKTPKLKRLEEKLKKKTVTRNVSVRVSEAHYNAIENYIKELHKSKVKQSIAGICQAIIEDFIDSELESYK